MAAPTFGDRVQETFTTTGTGAITLAGAVTGYQAFSAVVPNAGQCYYAATDGTNWEVGLGTYTTSGNTLTRTQILSSSNANAAVSWAAGTKTIYLDFPAFAAASIVPAFNAITGFLPSAITGTSTTGTLTVSAGQAAESLNTKYITKASTTSWAVANGNAINGYQGGTTLPNSSTIHFYAIEDVNGLNQGVFAVVQGTALVLPSTHTGGKSRRIFSLTTTAGGALNADIFNETDGGGLQVYLAAQQYLGLSATTTAILSSLPNIPLGFKMEAHFHAIVTTASYNGVLFTSPDEIDVLPTVLAAGGYNGTAPGFNANGASSAVAGWAPSLRRITNTTGQIRYRATAAMAVQTVTEGYRDFRRS